jgi:hypothetical protein
MLVDALWVRGLVATHRGQWEAAADAFDEALALARPMPYPYGQARALQGKALLNAQCGQRVRAGESLAEALTIFQRLGARKDIERVEQELAGLEAGSP